MQTVTPGKKKYVMMLIDNLSRYTTVYFLDTKDEAGMHIKRFIEIASTQFNKTPKCIRSDRGREYVNADLQNYLKNKGIKIQYTAAYSSRLERCCQALKSLTHRDGKVYAFRCQSGK